MAKTSVRTVPKGTTLSEGRNRHPTRRKPHLSEEQRRRNGGVVSPVGPRFGKKGHKGKKG